MHVFCSFHRKNTRYDTEVKFVHPVSPGGSVKFLASGVNFSIFTHFLCFFLLKLLKLGEIDGVKFLAWKSGRVKFWTNFMSAPAVQNIWCFPQLGRVQYQCNGIKYLKIFIFFKTYLNNFWWPQWEGTYQYNGKKYLKRFLYLKIFE